MLAMFTYPIKKHFPNVVPGATKYWLMSHILFGVLCTFFVLIHNRFTLGSLNSRVALFALLTVSLSGVIGRYLFMRIRRALSLNAVQLEKDKEALIHLQQSQPQAVDFQLVWEFLDEAQRRAKGNGLIYILYKRKVLKEFEKSVFSSEKSASTLNAKSMLTIKSQISTYLTSVRYMESLKTTEQIFSFWHYAHLPIVFLMVMCVLLHIYGVYMCIKGG